MAPRHIRATRHSAGSYAMVYLPAGGAVELDTSKLSGERLAAWWFDPRSGVAQAIGVLGRQARMSFTAPGGGPDWVLVLDDVAGGDAAPGRAA